MEQLANSLPKKVTLKLDKIGKNNYFSALEIGLSYTII